MSSVFRSLQVAELVRAVMAGSIIVNRELVRTSTTHSRDPILVFLESGVPGRELL